MRRYRGRSMSSWPIRNVWYVGKYVGKLDGLYKGEEREFQGRFDEE
jgi:hypothetical protein